MNTDIRVNISLTKHRKYKKLKRLLSCEPMLYLVVFWGAVAAQVPNGMLDGWADEDIDASAEWDGEPTLFCRSMVESGLLDVTPTGYYPHDWASHQPWAVGAPERSEAARKAGKASAEARRKNKRINGE